MSTPTLVYAFALGLAAAVNPCGFPLLPAYLAVFLGTEPAPVSVRLLRALRAAAAMTGGFVLVFAVVGIIVSAGLRVGSAWTPVFAAIVGLLLLFAGVFGMAGKELRLPAIALPFRAGRSFVAMAGYGGAFAATSLGCSFPLFLAAASPSITGGDPLGPLTAALAYALGMGLFVAACSVVASVVGAEAIRVAGRFARFLPRVASFLLTVVGIYLFAYGTSLVLAPGRQPALQASVAGAAEALGTGLVEHPLIVGGVATVVVLASLTVAAAATRRHDPHPPERQ